MKKYQDFSYLNLITDERLNKEKGRPVIASLFLERDQGWKNHNDPNRIVPIYTLEETDRDGCISFYQIYMHSSDEYDFSMKVFGSYTYWETLCKDFDWFKPFLEKYRRHSLLKQFSLAKKTLMKDAVFDVTSAKKLLDLCLKELNDLNPTSPKKNKPKENEDDVHHNIENDEELMAELKKHGLR